MKPYGVTGTVVVVLRSTVTGSTGVVSVFCGGLFTLAVGGGKTPADEPHFTDPQSLPPKLGRSHPEVYKCHGRNDTP